jgi:hypothetical protein
MAARFQTQAQGYIVEKLSIWLSPNDPPWIIIKRQFQSQGDHVVS